MHIQLLFFLAVIPAFFPLQTHATEPWHTDYAKLLNAYVHPTGVDYEAWHASETDRETLRTIVGQLAASGPEDSSKEGALAFYANAYNLWVLHLVLEKWPLGSVVDYAPEFGFFANDRIEIAGERMSLNTLEKEILLKRFGDARIHFIINCASRSCPPLPPKPLNGATLEEQMTSAAASFINDQTHGVADSEDGKVRVSRIFDWYKTDFEKAAGGVIPFIDKYRREPLPADVTLEFMDYSWAMNRAE